MASRNFLQMLIALLGLALSNQLSEAGQRFTPLPHRFPFKIDPDTPLDDLLPQFPVSKWNLPKVLNDDLANVPELKFAQPLAKDLDFLKAQEAIAHQMAKINHLNAKNDDGFMKAYLAKRADLRGLPFVMGKDCRTEVKA